MNLIMEGSCVCTDIQFHITGEPLFSYVCHCLNCQKRSGSAFEMCTNILESDFELVSGSPKVYDHGRVQQMACDDCGTLLWVSFTGSNVLLVLSGVLSNKTDLSPKAHIWIHRKQPWLQLDDETPQFNDEYDLRSLWSASSLARVAKERVDDKGDQDD